MSDSPTDTKTTYVTSSWGAVPQHAELRIDGAKRGTRWALMGAVYERATGDCIGVQVYGGSRLLWNPDGSPKQGSGTMRQFVPERVIANLTKSQRRKGRPERDDQND